MNTKKRGEAVSSKNKRKAANRRNPADKVGAARRSLWYILKVIVIIAVIIAFCYAVFIEAVYVSNIFIIATEGMEMRADCILKNDSARKLAEHFSGDWLMVDEALKSSKYDAFHVDSYIYNIKIKKLTVYPWSETAKLEIIENVSSISAKPYSESTASDIPKWESAKYGILMKKDKGRWIIDEIILIDAEPELEPAHTPDYSKLQTDIPHW